MVQRESIQEGAEDEQTHKGPKLFPRGRQKPPVQAASIHEADLRAREARNPAPERLPAGLGAVEFQRGFGSHKRRPHLPGSPINHVALIRMPVVELRGARRHSRLGLWASDAAHRSRAAASRPVCPGPFPPLVPNAVLGQTPVPLGETAWHAARRAGRADGQLERADCGSLLPSSGPGMCDFAED